MQALCECLLFVEVHDMALSKHKELLYFLSVTSREQIFSLAMCKALIEGGVEFTHESDRTLQCVRRETIFCGYHGTWSMVINT